MTRRDLIALFGSAAATWPLAARAQQPAMPVIGFLGPGSAGGNAPFLDGFRRGLSAAGFAEGRNVAVEYRWADNRPDRLAALALTEGSFRQTGRNLDIRLGSCEGFTDP